jgi:hypothetical protein
MTVDALGGRVLDATAIHDLTIGRTIYGAAFLAAANDLGITLAIPATALQEAWAAADLDDHPFLDLLLSLPLSIVETLDTEAARRSGLLARGSHAAGHWDAGATHAVLVALDRSWPILTSEPHALRQVDAQIDVDVLPD